MDRQDDERAVATLDNARTQTRVIGHEPSTTYHEDGHAY